MNSAKKSFFKGLAPILGAGAIGVCPICWVGSASLISFIGLGALIPIWQWLALGLLGLGFVGIFLDKRYHHNSTPMISYLVGTVLLYVGRYVFAKSGIGNWYIWGPGAILIIYALIQNKKLFQSPNKNSS